MKIKEAIRLKEGNSFVGLDSNDNTIHITVYNGLAKVEVNSGLNSTYYLYKEDEESYEPISVYTFNRMLRLAKYRINNYLK